MKLYSHKTDGGAEYLMDTYLLCDYCNKCKAETPNDGSENCNECGGEKHKEGVMADAKYVVRIDGDITKDAELMIADSVFEDIIKNYKKGKKYPF